jgi:hypothetical protein
MLLAAVSLACPLTVGCQQPLAEEQTSDISARAGDPIERLVAFSVAVAPAGGGEDSETLKTVTTSVNGSATNVPCTQSAVTKLVDAIKLRECSYYIAGPREGTLINPTCFLQRACPAGVSMSLDETFRITASGQAGTGFSGQFETQGRIAITWDVSSGAPAGTAKLECSPVDRSAAERLAIKVAAQVERACGGPLTP